MTLHWIITLYFPSCGSVKTVDATKESLAGEVWISEVLTAPYNKKSTCQENYDLKQHKKTYIFWMQHRL